MAKKQIIWSSDYYMNDEAREEYENSQRELLDDDGYSVSDRIWTEVVDGYLSDERMNLDQKVDGVIIAFADLGLWRGRRQGYMDILNKLTPYGLFVIDKTSSDK